MANTFTTGLATTMSLNGSALIESGSTTSAEIPNSGRAVVRLGFPTITSTTVTFQVQPYPASGEVAAASFRSLVDKDGNAVSYTIASNTVVTIPELSGCAAFKFIMGSAEGADRTIEVTSRGDNPVVSPTEVDVNIESGATITANQGTAGAQAWPVKIDQTTPGTTNGVQVNAALPAGTNLLGVVAAGASTSAIYNGTTAVTPVFAAISGASSGDNTLVSADATKKIRVFALSIVAAGAVTVRFESAAGGTALTGVMSFAANGGYVLPFNPAGWFETAANQLLNMELGGAVQVSGHLTYGLV